jgi:hypothetical protein
LGTWGRCEDLGEKKRLRKKSVKLLTILKFGAAVCEQNENHDINFMNSPNYFRETFLFITLGKKLNGKIAIL